MLLPGPVAQHDPAVLAFDVILLAEGAPLERRHREYLEEAGRHVQGVQLYRGAVPQTDTSAAEVCRRYGISTGLYYRWLDQVYENADRLFEKKSQGSEALGELEAENRRLKEVIAEITTENLDPKKNAWSLEDHATLSRELWPAIVVEVEQTRRRSGWTTRRTLKALGVSRAPYYRQRQAREEDRSPVPDPVAVHRITPEERAAVVAFKLAHPELRHRSLAWTMIDEDVAYLSPSSVYRILSEEELLDPWERGKRGTGKKPHRPSRPNELWLPCTSEKRTGSRRNVGSSSPWPDSAGRKKT